MFAQRLDQMFTSEKSYKFVSCAVAIFSEMGIDEHTYYNYMKDLIPKRNENVTNTIRLSLWRESFSICVCTWSKIQIGHSKWQSIS